LGNLIKSYAYDLKEIKYAGYAKYHPLDNILTIRLSSNKDNSIENIKKLLVNISNNIISIINELILDIKDL